MSERNLHAKPFDAGTQEKLTIYREYLQEWLPVFLNTGAPFSRIQIFDFFAGPGFGINGEAGSPIIALEEIHNAIETARARGLIPVAVDVYLNEFSREKYSKLVSNVQSHRFYHDMNVVFAQQNFPEAFDAWYPIMNRPKVANLVFLDQNGVKQVTTDIFSRLSSLRHTDYMFYIASAIVNRFKKDPNVIQPLPITDFDLQRMNGTNVHVIVKEAYERIAIGKFLAPFSIRKGANVYGLIFGSEHLLGLDKFLSVCWKLDKVLGVPFYDRLTLSF